MMASRSCPVRIPWRASMVACAIEPWISCGDRRWSNSTEAVKASTKASVGSVKRPAQSFLSDISKYLLRSELAIIRALPAKRCLS